MRISGIVAGGARPRAVALGVVFALLALMLMARVAVAAKGVVSVFGASGSGDGQFANAFGTAVNVSSGDVYVVDQFDHRVERFDSSGAFVGVFGWGVADGSSAAQTCSSSCQPGIAGSGDGQFDTPQGIAVRQSDGAVFVVDGNDNRVERFDAAGGYQAQFGIAGSTEGQFSGPQGVAVDPTDGSVYVADSANNRVQKFDSAGSFVRTFGFGVADGSSTFQTCTSTCQAGLAVPDDGGFSGPTRVAVDSTGRVYVLDSGSGRIERYTPASAFDQIFDSTDVFAPQEITVGPANDDLYVAQWAQDFSEQHVVQLSPAGSLIDTHGVGSTANNSSGLALGAANQKIYLADGFNARVFVLDDVTAPDVALDPASGVTSTTASLSGTVNPNGNPDMGWRFEISTDDANWSALAADQDPGNGSSPVPVSQDLTGLVPNTTYYARLVAKRALNAPTISSEIQFTTSAIPPDVTTGVADDVKPDHAVLQGLIHPHNSPTTYYFEYGTTTAYGNSSPATQDADAGAANRLDQVLRRVDGLQPATTYHFRLVATNTAATTHGGDQTFTTGAQPPSSTLRAGISGSGFLPDNRGWEKVSPGDKNGGDIMPDSGRSHVAIDGSAAQFSSLTAFGDVIGTGVATDYVSVRDPKDGWITHAVTPHQAPTAVQPLVRGLQSLYLGFANDLSRGVFLGWSPVTADPNVANVANLYMRDDPKTPSAGSYQVLSACPLCASSGTPLPPLQLGSTIGFAGDGQPRFAGASMDFGNVIFESQEPLTSDAPSGCTNLANVNQCPVNLYEWDHGTVRLAGLLPACGTPPCPLQRSIAGQGAGAAQGAVRLTPHTISADGSRIFFTVPDAPRSPSGALYMRLHHSTTVQLNASERTPPDPTGPQSATYWDASTDGSRVFFTTAEALTADAPPSGDKLYMYDASKPDSDPHNITLISVDHQPADGHNVVNVQGTSSDGHYVYFAAAGQLVAGQPLLSSDRGLYVWHDGITKYITAMQTFLDEFEDTTTTQWSLFRATARVTPDGLHLLFSSSVRGVGPTGYDQGNCGDTDGGGCREFYLYNYASDGLACVSCNPSSTTATASAFTALRLNTSGSVTSPAQNHSLTDDGQHVFFSTSEALVAPDVNRRVDVYEYNAPTGTVHLVTTGTERSDSYFMDASPSGSDALLLTRAQLTGADKDGNYDMYDARINGGFLEPPPAPRSCTGDACQGPQSQVPEAPSRGSSLIAGNGASPSKGKPKAKAKPCRKGYVRKKMRGKARCVKKRKASKVHKTRKTSKAKRSRSQRRAK